MIDHGEPKEWIRLCSELDRFEGRFLVCVLGASDTGKSSLCRYLVLHFRQQGCRVALIDADLGQSTLGPPATVGMKVFSLLKGKDDPSFFRFVGYISPVKHMLQTLVAIRALVDRAVEQGVEGIILDTSGFLFGKVALEFKFQKIEVVNPTHLIALERNRELEVLLKNFSHRRSLSLRRLLVPDFVQVKFREQRRQYRKERFWNYFQEARIVNFNFRGMGLHGHLPNSQNSRDWQDLVVGFCDDRNDTLALGIIKNVDLRQKEFSCLTPLQQWQKVRSIQFGSLYLDQKGREFFRKV